MAELKIWMNGKLVPQAEAVLPVNSAAVFYATNVFEGLRAYWNEADEELYSFRLDEHFTRLRESMKMMRFTVPYSDADLRAAVHDVLAGNEIREDIHMHLVAYVVGAGMDSTSPTGLYINPRRRGRLTEEGLRCCVSSWARTNDNAIPIRLKCGANYQNGRLALLQAKADGYDAPIFLNQQGKVAEGTGATFFMVRKGKLVTPPITADILESITRTTLIESICPDMLGLDVVEREIDRTELYVAEEAFFCGSGYEITPIVSPEAPHRLHERRAGQRQALPGVAHPRVPHRAQVASRPRGRGTTPPAAEV
jgi:branched-chain amino acid aminotransferase